MRFEVTTVTLILGATVTGCASFVITDGQIRPGVLNDVVQNTVRARGIEIDRPINAQVVSRTELHGVLADALADVWPAPKLQRYERAIVALGLWPQDRDVRTEILAAGSEYEGVYVWLDSAIYIVNDARSRLSSFIQRRDRSLLFALSHEIVHALQHRAYPELLDVAGSHDQDDMGLAVRSAIEGDATRYGYRAMRPHEDDISPERFKRHIETTMLFSSHSALHAAPALMRLARAYTYAEGYGLSYREGRALLDYPPASTEQTLHPSRRFEDFWVFELSAAVAALPSGCALEHTNTMGELQLSILFRDLADEPSRLAWEGWDGDRFLVASCGDRLEFAWLTAWDTVQDAREFEAAYNGIASAVATRAGYQSPPRADRESREVIVASTGLQDFAVSLPSRARRERVATVEEVREHFPIRKRIVGTRVGRERRPRSPTESPNR